MSKKELIKTEQAVLDLIGAQDFRSISKAQIMQFVSEIPNMDKEIAISCIEQFPEFTNYSKEIVSSLFVLYNAAMEDHKVSRKSAIESYQQILDTLKELSLRPNLSVREQQYFIDQSVDIADKIAELHRNNAEFLDTVMKKAGQVGAVALGIAGAILGVKFLGPGKD